MMSHLVLKKELVRFHKSREIQQAFEDVGHIYFHLLMLHNAYLDTSKAVSLGMNFKIIKQY